MFKAQIFDDFFSAISRSIIDYQNIGIRFSLMISCSMASMLPASFKVGRKTRSFGCFTLSDPFCTNKTRHQFFKSNLGAPTGEAHKFRWISLKRDCPWLANNQRPFDIHMVAKVQADRRKGDTAEILKLFSSPLAKTKS